MGSLRPRRWTIPRRARLFTSVDIEVAGPFLALCGGVSGSYWALSAWAAHQWTLGLTRMVVAIFAVLALDFLASRDWLDVARAITSLGRRLDQG